MIIEITLKQLIKGIIEHEGKFESKLDLLTSIGTGSINPKIFRACEEIRDELVSDAPGEEGPANDVSGSGVLRNCRKPRRSKSNNDGSINQESGRNE